MLLNDFYTIETAGSEMPAPVAAEARAVLVLNATHPIFTGHFPGQPVVPGACQLQMVEELLSHALGSEYRLVKADQLKFLTPIDPRVFPRIEASLQYVATRAEIPPGGGQTAPAHEARTSSGPVAGSQTAPAEWQVAATLSAGDTVFLKFTGTFRAV